ncbi:hypothetical protein ABK040_011984 [Willaertia magna]
MQRNNENGVPSSNDNKELSNQQQLFVNTNNNNNGNSGSSSTEKMLFASFNQDFSCVSIGTDCSYKIFTLDPLKKCYSQPGGMSVVQMLYSSSLLALVGAGHQASLSPRRLQLFNSSENKAICELNFTSTILNIKLSKRRLVVVLQDKLHLFDISSMKILRTIETENKLGLCALSSIPSSTPTGVSGVKNDVSYLAFPSGSEVGDVVLYDAINPRPINVIKAHKSDVSIIQFNQDGSMLATASGKGTVIRIFSIPGCELLTTLRRGSTAARIYSISFNADSSLVCVSSDKGTVHVFKLTSTQGDDKEPKKRQNVGTLSDTLHNMWDSVRNFAHASVKLPESETRNICGITPNNEALIVVSFDGYIHRFGLDLVNGGEMALETKFKVIENRDQFDETNKN